MLLRSRVRGSLLVRRTIGIVLEFAVNADDDFALLALPGMAITEMLGALNAQVGRFSRTAFLRAAHGSHYTRTAWRCFAIGDVNHPMIYRLAALPEDPAGE